MAGVVTTVCSVFFQFLNLDFALDDFSLYGPGVDWPRDELAEIDAAYDRMADVIQFEQEREWIRQVDLVVRQVARRSSRRCRSVG